MTSSVLLERDGHVAVITINREDIRNANSTPDVIEAMVDVIEQVNRDPGFHAAVITGAGKTFSAGGEFKLMESFNTMPTIDVNHYYRHHGIQRFTRALYDLEVPAVAAVNGPAYGSGFGMALLCDLRIASETATFAMNFSKLGILPGDGGALFLTRAVGPQNAAEIFYTGEPISASRALEMGLVLKVLPFDEVLPEALRLARQIADRPGPALRLMERLLREAGQAQFSGFLDLTAAMQAMCHTTVEHKDALDRLKSDLAKRAAAKAAKP